VGSRRANLPINPRGSPRCSLRGSRLGSHRLSPSVGPPATPPASPRSVPLGSPQTGRLPLPPKQSSTRCKFRPRLVCLASAPTTFSGI
jgi:hypothetical protein